MTMGRAISALWIVCAALIAWVWLRPMHEGWLPAPVARAARKARVDPRGAPVAQPEDEPVAEEPTAQPVHAGPPEQLNRHDLESALDKVKPKVLQCREVEQFAGFLTVKLTIEKSGAVKSIAVQPPVDKTRTADCVKHALRGLSFPHFRGTWVPQIEWSYPFLFAESAPAGR
ncbi:MAG TPA: hypothetical protein VF945_06570 [Polyangia bacterium]